MSTVFGKEIAWKQIDVLTTFGTCMDFDPKEVFYGGGCRAAKKALRPI
jgi:hypothetical protein